MGCVDVIICRQKVIYTCAFIPQFINVHCSVTLDYTYKYLMNNLLQLHLFIKTQIDADDTSYQKGAVIIFVCICRPLIRAYIHYTLFPFKEHSSITFPYTFGSRVMYLPMSCVVEEIQTDIQNLFSFSASLFVNTTLVPPLSNFLHFRYPRRI